jgi:hypothetical protein
MNYFATGELLPAEDNPKRRHLEEDFQRQVVQFLRVAAPERMFFFHVPNGGQRHSKVAAKLIGQGLRAGVPDLAVIWEGQVLFLELKTARGATSLVQRQVHKQLGLAGAWVWVCRTLDEVIEALTAFGIPLRARAL